MLIEESHVLDQDFIDSVSGAEVSPMTLTEVYYLIKLIEESGAFN